MKQSQFYVILACVFGSHEPLNTPNAILAFGAVIGAFVWHLAEKRN